MAMYGDRHIKINDLKTWALQLSVDDIKSVNIGGMDVEVNSLEVEILKLQVETFKKGLNN